MVRFTLISAALFLGLSPVTMGREAKPVRYPGFHNGKVAFCYLGDIWLADTEGKGAKPVTVHKARDAYPRFAPGGRRLAFSSDRVGEPGRLRDRDNRRGDAPADGALSR